MYHSKLYMIRSYSNWNHEIFGAIKDFIACFEKMPNILLASSPTQDRISTAMSTEIIEQGLTNTYQEISTFSCELGDVEVCLDRELALNYFLLIYDDESYFAPDDGEATSYSPEAPNQKKASTGS